MKHLPFSDLFSSTIVSLIYDEPFFAELIMRMRTYVTTDVPTAAVNVTDKVNLYINPHFFNDLSLHGRVNILKHECVLGDVILDTDKGPLKIKEIVNKQLSVKVLSLSKSGKKEYKNVISYSKKDMKDYPDKHWVSIKYTDNDFLYSTVVCTNDHKIACLDNPLDTQVKYVKAEDSVGLYSIRKVDRNRLKNKENPQYNKQQLDIILGCLLGDSHANKTSFRSVGSKANEEYTQYKQYILGGEIIPSYSGYTDSYSNLTINHNFNHQVKYLKELMYENNKKTVKNILDLITPISLAFWYTDDGSWDEHGSSFLHTEGFTYADNELLQTMLKDKFEIDVEIVERSHKENLYMLKLKKESTFKLFNIIAQYIHPSMQYKIHETLRNKFKLSNIDNIPLDYSVRKITKVKKLKKRSKSLYDIGVEDNHNFFANNTLVHNCYHVMFDHFSRFTELNPEVFDKKEKTTKEIVEGMTNAQTLNMAADYAINEYLELPKTFRLFDKDGKCITQPAQICNEKGEVIDNPNVGKDVEAKPLLVVDLKKQHKNVEHKQTMEYYYDIVNDNKDENSDGTGDGKGSLIDDHSLWEKGSKDSQYIKEQIKGLVNDAAEAAKERKSGSISYEIQALIDSLNYTPRNWKQDLQRFISRSQEILVESSVKKRNRRYGIIYPGIKTYPKLHVAVLFDASGSVSDDEAGQFFAEIKRIWENGTKVTVIEFDAKVNAVYEFNPKTPPKLHGRGGTMFSPAFEEVKNHDVDGIIMLTDGCNFDHNEVVKPKVPMLWAILEGYKCSYDWGYKTTVTVNKKKAA